MFATAVTAPKLKNSDGCSSFICVCYSGSQGMEPTTLFPRKTMHTTNFAHVQQYSDKWDYTTASKSGLQKIAAAAVLLSLSIQVPVNWLVMQPGE